MKKTSLLAIALCVSAAMIAQDNQPQLRTPMEKKARFGIRAGGNLAKFRTTDFPAGTEPDLQTKTSLFGGLFLNAPLGGSFAIQPGVEYGGQGTKLAMGSTNSEVDFHYINVPVMLQLKTTGGFFLETGPQVGYLISAKQGNVDIKDDTKTIDFSWGAGLGYLSRIGLGINGRFNYGLSNLQKGDNSTDTSPQFKNQVIQLGLIYHFGAAK